MPVNETTQLERDLASEVGVEVDRIYCNGLYPQRFSVADTERIATAAEALAGPANAACRAALTAAHRAADQREQLARLEANVKAPVVELPFLFDAHLGVEEIEHLADAMAA
jgi:hypothetical protein